jgi:Protein of unknown function, DUF547
MRKKVLFKAFTLSIGLGAVLVAGPASPLAASAFDHSHSIYGRVLAAYVLEGLVDYTGLKKNPDDLNAYLDRLASVSREEFGEWSETQQIAFLTNLYNAATLKLIIDHYPVKSIRKIGVPCKGPWKQEVVRLFGERVTLDHVEHDLLRKDYKEPRIHFALVCAARSCPALRREPYIPERLDAQLADQGRLFLNDPSKNRVDLESRTVYLSKIFEWFRGDFEEHSRSVLAFVLPYLPNSVSKQVRSETFMIEYLDYDWTLNDQEAKPS